MGLKNEVQPSFVLNQLQGVWKQDKTLFRAFEITDEVKKYSYKVVSVLNFTILK